MTARFTESMVEEAALAWLESLGHSILHGAEIVPGEADTRALFSTGRVIVGASKRVFGK